MLVGRIVVWELEFDTNSGTDMTLMNQNTDTLMKHIENENGHRQYLCVS